MQFIPSNDHRYPETPEQQASRTMLGGPDPKTPRHISDQFTRVNRMYGSNDLDQVAKSSGSAGIIPWPMAGKTKKGANYDKDLVRAELSKPVNLTATDPRQLHASQPGITRDGVDYYRGANYQNTGETYADQDNAGNRFPVVYNKEDGRSILLSGHHRATAALIQGKQFDARHISGK